MRIERFISHCVLIAAVVLVGCNGQEATVEAFSSEAGEFSISTPAPFEETQQSVDTPVGTVEIVTFTAETEQSAYVVAYTDYPPEIVEQSNPQELLDSSRDGAVTNIGGTLVREKEIDLKGNPGRSLLINANTDEGDATMVRSDIYLVGNRLYQVLVVAPEPIMREGSADRFLQSFNLQ